MIALRRSLKFFDLRFDEKKLEDFFSKQNFIESINSVRWSFILGFVLYGLFGVLDAWVAYDVRHFIWGVRYAVVMPVLGAMIIFSFYHRQYHRSFYLLSIVTSYILMLGIIAMLVVIEDTAVYLYYVGLLLVVFWECVLLRFAWVLSVLFSAVTIVSFNIVCFAIKDLPVYLVVNCNFFLLATACVGTLASYTIEHFSRVQFLQRRELDQRAQQLFQVNAELEKSLSQIQSSQVRLIQSEKMSALGQMVAGVAHEVNSPRAAIDHYILLAERQLEKITTSGSDDQSHLSVVRIRDVYIPAMRDNIEKIGMLTDGLLNFARTGHNDLKESNLHQILESVIVIFKSQYQSRITVEKKLGSIPLFYCYPGQINQLVMNILTNAAEAIAEHGTITVTTSATRSDIKLEIEDTGCGMDDMIKQKIFDPFFTTKDVGNGKGLGMSIVWDIVQKHGAAINVTSQVGVGTHIDISFPIRRSTTRMTGDTYNATEADR